jgi:hypothetical protein
MALNDGYPSVPAFIQAMSKNPKTTRPAIAAPSRSELIRYHEIRERRANQIEAAVKPAVKTAEPNRTPKNATFPCIPSDGLA